MNKKIIKLVLAGIVISVSVAGALNASAHSPHTIEKKEQVFKINTPARYQWIENNGYCGEVSMISAGLYYGQYLSQYDARAIAFRGVPQTVGKLLLSDESDARLAEEMHLNFTTWSSSKKDRTAEQFLAWVKQNVIKGYPVAIALYMNQYRFGESREPAYESEWYDHLVSVTGIGTFHSPTDPDYYADDKIYFSDHGAWKYADNPPYHFSYSFAEFQKDRVQANAKNGLIYSLMKQGPHFGIAITGVRDLNNDTVPVRLETDVNNEKYAIKEGSNDRPAAVPIRLKVTVSGLQPGTDYTLYRYNSLSRVPDSEFNAHASSAHKSWKIKIASGSTYVFNEDIRSDEIAVYRAVKASAP